MAAPKKEKERKRVYDEAIRLFQQQGYTKTKYSDIAAACGGTKSMVQHYYPKKEQFAIEYLNKHLEGIAKEAQKYAGEDTMKLFCMMGLMHFHTLLNDPAMKLFYDDILASRELTSVLTKAERDWAQVRLDVPNDGPVFVKDALTTALGGAYELMFQARREGKQLSASYVEYAGMLPFAMSIGYSRQEIIDILEECISNFQPK